MTLRSLLRRRPSAALVVSFLALFVALGGAGWAAFRLPVHSVGNAQLQNFSVGNAKLRPNSVGAGKIIAGAVGARQVDSSQVQLRVSGPCTLGAIQSISVSGNVTCTPVLPNEYGTSNPTAVAVRSSGTQVASQALPASAAGATYLVIGNVRWNISESASASQSVDLLCTLQGGTHTTAGEVTVQLGPNQTTQVGAIPIVLPVSASPPSQSAAITCQYQAVGATPGPAPSQTVTVDATINAIQTASNS
jgi:hypothetical protein